MAQATKSTEELIQAEVLAVRQTMQAFSTPVAGLFTELSSLEAQIEALDEDLPLGDEPCFGSLSTEYEIKKGVQMPPSVADNPHRQTMTGGSTSPPSTAESRAVKSRREANTAQPEQAPHAPNPSSATPPSKPNHLGSSVSTAHGSNKVSAGRSESAKNLRALPHNHPSLVRSDRAADEPVKPVFSLSRSTITTNVTAHTAAEVKREQPKGLNGKSRPASPGAISPSTQRIIDKGQRNAMPGGEHPSEFRDTKLHGKNIKQRSGQRNTAAPIDTMERIAHLAEQLLKLPATTPQPVKPHQLNTPTAGGIPANAASLAQAPITREIQTHTTTDINKRKVADQTPLNHACLNKNHVTATHPASGSCALDSKTLSELVNDALIDQARRNGVDLS